MQRARGVIHSPTGCPQTGLRQGRTHDSWVHHWSMDTNQWHGAVTRAELIAQGNTPSEIRTALQDNMIRPLAPGIYASPALWDEPMETRHGELGRATLRKLGGNYLLGAHSARRPSTDCRCGAWIHGLSISFDRPATPGPVPGPPSAFEFTATHARTPRCGSTVSRSPARHARSSTWRVGRRPPLQL